MAKLVATWEQVGRHWSVIIEFRELIGKHSEIPWPVGADRRPKEAQTDSAQESTTTT